MRPPANNMPHYTASWIKLADVSTEIRIMPDMLVFQDDAIKNRHYSTTCRDENELRKLHRAGLIDMNTHATEHVMLNSGHILLSVDGAVQLFNTYRARYYDAEEIMCFLVGQTDRETAMFTHFKMIIVETRVRVMDRRVTIFDPRSQLLSDYDDNTLTRTFRFIGRRLRIPARHAYKWPNRAIPLREAVHPPFIHRVRVVHVESESARPPVVVVERTIEGTELHGIADRPHPPPGVATAEYFHADDSDGISHASHRATASAVTSTDDRDT